MWASSFSLNTHIGFLGSRACSLSKQHTSEHSLHFKVHVKGLRFKPGAAEKGAQSRPLWYSAPTPHNTSHTYIWGFKLWEWLYQRRRRFGRRRVVTNFRRRTFGRRLPEHGRDSERRGDGDLFVVVVVVILVAEKQNIYIKFGQKRSQWDGLFLFHPTC